jgi:hypothetical protein
MAAFALPGNMQCARLDPRVFGQVPLFFIIAPAAQILVTAVAFNELPFGVIDRIAIEFVLPHGRRAGSFCLKTRAD